MVLLVSSSGIPKGGLVVIKIAMESNSTASAGPTDINNLFPALVECFGIILLGYASGRFGFISTAQGKGIGNFVSHFALPALLFKSMVELDFLKVNWKFLAVILIAKGIVFIIVVVLTLILGKPQKYGRAGIFAIFCTQSNDFALGFPICKLLHKIYFCNSKCWEYIKTYVTG